MMSQTHLTKSQCAQILLGFFDLAKALDRHLRAVGQSRRQAGRSGQIRGWQSRRPRQVAYLLLRQSDLLEGRQHAMFIGGPLAWAKIRSVVGIDAITDPVEAEFDTQTIHRFEEFTLAVITPVRSIGAISASLHLVGVDETMAQTKLLDDLLCHRAVAVWVGRRHRGHRQTIVSHRPMSGPGEVA